MLRLRERCWPPISWSGTAATGSHTRNASDGRLRKVEDFMRENLASAVSLEDLAREAGVSRFHLLRLYKKLYGQTPLKRLTFLRMEEALSRSGFSCPD